MLQSFEPGMRAAIVGASGGIGGALTDLLANDPHVVDVRAFSRSTPSPDSRASAHHFIDIQDERSVAAAAAEIGDVPLDLVIVTTGILHRGADIQPEKSLRNLDPVSMAEVFAINAVGPAIVAKHFLPLMRRSGKSVFAALSARVGSISDNRLGGWASYRASKSALNMLLKTFSIEHARRFPDGVVAALHPGTVDTSLSRPFTARTPSSGLFDAATSAQCLIDVIDRLSVEDTGGFFAWDGSEIAY